jgi:hypothetical protein
MSGMRYVKEQHLLNSNAAYAINKSTSIPFTQFKIILIKCHLRVVPINSSYSVHNHRRQIAASPFIPLTSLIIIVINGTLFKFPSSSLKTPYVSHNHHHQTAPSRSSRDSVPLDKVSASDLGGRPNLFLADDRNKRRADGGARLRKFSRKFFFQKNVAKIFYKYEDVITNSDF